MNATAQVLDGTVAVLWGSVERSLTWVHLDRKNGTVVVAKATRSGFMVRELSPVPDLVHIARKAELAWRLLRDGRDLPAWATHRLKPPTMQIIEPLPDGDQ